ncbi:MAG: DUF4038 domain-containing protein, partial [Bacteroidota bacterium]
MRYLLLCLLTLGTASLNAQMLPLKVHPDGRFLMKSDDTPFFYLGDTAWELFHRCSRFDIDLYLRNRAAKGFTVVQCVLIG